VFAFGPGLILNDDKVFFLLFPSERDGHLDAGEVKLYRVYQRFRNYTGCIRYLDWVMVKVVLS